MSHLGDKRAFALVTADSRLLWRSALLVLAMDRLGEINLYLRKL